MEEHPIDQPIRHIQIDSVPGAGPDADGNAYTVGESGVTRIEACQKSGMHANIPYVRVWADDQCIAEFCQHNIVGIYFEQPVEQPSAETLAIWKANGIANHVNGTCTSCERPAAECDCVPF